MYLAAIAGRGASSSAGAIAARVGSAGRRGVLPVAGACRGAVTARVVPVIARIGRALPVAGRVRSLSIALVPVRNGIGRFRVSLRTLAHPCGCMELSFIIPCVVFRQQRNSLVQIYMIGVVEAAGIASIAQGNLTSSHISQSGL